jgi:lipoprotein signal peptidase
MALINCNECSNKVSDKAPSCPKCGSPIANIQETIAAGVSLSTVQETSKKFKLQSLISALMIIVGVVLSVINAKNGQEISGISILLITSGFIWNIINRIRIWWHHK